MTQQQKDDCIRPAPDTFAGLRLYEGGLYVFCKLLGNKHAVTICAVFAIGSVCYFTSCIKTVSIGHMVIMISALLLLFLIAITPYWKS